MQLSTEEAKRGIERSKLVRLPCRTFHSVLYFRLLGKALLLHTLRIRQGDEVLGTKCELTEYLQRRQRLRKRRLVHERVRQQRREEGKRTYLFHIILVHQGGTEQTKWWGAGHEVGVMYMYIKEVISYSFL